MDCELGTGFGTGFSVPSASHASQRTEAELKPLVAETGAGLAQRPRCSQRELSLRTEGEKAEAEKDIERLANHGEGVLIYGIAETVMEDGSRAAGELTPVARPLAEHLNNVLDSRGDPRVPFDLHRKDSAERSRTR
jgi:hypothetical protein